MKMLLKISWRNIWRNRKRSLVMILAISIGLWGGIFAAALSLGLLDQRFELSVGQHISHVQMHNPDFLKDNNVKHAINEWEKLEAELSSDPEVLAFSGRTIINGMLASANLTRGVNIIGIQPEHEAATTGLDNNTFEGSFFESDGRNQVLIGQALASKTKLQERSRLVLTFQNADGELISATFRVAGIFQTSNSMYDEMHVYVLRSDLDAYAGQNGIVNEVAVLGQRFEDATVIRDRYSALYPGLSIRDWAEISPELSYMQEMAGMMMNIVIIIILFALAFGLVNTMLMSIFERVRELGVLMAVGMKKSKIFAMIMIETTCLTFLGAFGGAILGLATISLFGNRGIDLAAVGGDSLNTFGFPSVIYPQLEPAFFLNLTILVLITALLTAIYPAMRALKLNPAEAVRKE